MPPPQRRRPSTLASASDAGKGSAVATTWDLYAVVAPLLWFTASVALAGNNTGALLPPSSIPMAQMISRLKHENFVEILGYCVERNMRPLAYEFATIGSLHDVLHGSYGRVYFAILDNEKHVSVKKLDTSEDGSNDIQIEA
ncbi:hypothetical protein ZIOFF_009663 [Zingiber officinale]|uniref:Serine-threonine/tyrosine-protein kinase catalytic domain-containing protein n=1 Tax=Zingiber officinale TaxID=94328 RepID=A0A8J5LXJ1_ZINOF|nr:hypothetical protein ZIOFF_009663 [Zingiber officinale]